MASPKKIALVLGGGGMKGLAHIGVLKVLHRLGIQPNEFIGTSVGALIAAMAAAGMPVEEMERVALSIRKNNVLDYRWLSVFWNRGRIQSVCRGKQFHDFIRRVLPVDDFSRLKYPLYITSVDINNGKEIIWGLPGLDDVPIHDCVMASCSIPGIFPPKKINGSYFVDGSLANTLPIRIATYHKADLIVAVYMESPATFFNRDVPKEGIFSILTQSQSIISQTMMSYDLLLFPDAPIILIEPQVLTYGMFDFNRNARVIEAGVEAAAETLTNHPLIQQFAAAKSMPST